MGQEILKNVIELETVFRKMHCKKILLVCDSVYPFLNVKGQIDRLSVHKVIFNDFQPNPKYESVIEGIKVLHQNRCDAIFAVGGGSAIDVAKCIKLYANMDGNSNYLHRDIISNDIPLIAMPTTAGTGSEATRYAVVYYKGEKQSITSDSIIPTTVIMDSSVLKTLPEYQRKTTMLDALCHGIESWWSINSTEESKFFSEKSVRKILAYQEAYLANEEKGNTEMLWAAHLAGKAINIAQTTAGHAMCYKLTNLYGMAHGHAAALCLPEVWNVMLGHPELCNDPRGKAYLGETFQNIAEAMGCITPQEAVEFLRSLLRNLNLSRPHAIDRNRELDILVESVNPVRMKNNPSMFSKTALRKMYERIV